MSKLDRLQRLDLLDGSPLVATPPAAPIPLQLPRGPVDWNGRTKQRWWTQFSESPWHLPASGAESLRATIGNRWGLAADSVALANCQAGAWSAVLTAWGWQHPLLYPVPTNPLYAQVARALEIQAIAVMTGADFSFPLGQVIAAARAHQAGVVALSNPAEPSGGLITRDEILTLARETEALVVVDERLAIWSGFSVADAIPEVENLVVIQGLGAETGAAAFEASWILGCPRVVAVCGRVPGANGLNLPAELAVRWVLEETDELGYDFRAMCQARETIRAALSQLDGVVSWPSAAPYLLVGTTLPGDELAAALLKHGIATQTFARPPLRNCIRVFVGSEQENQAFIAAMTQTFKRF